MNRLLRHTWPALIGLAFIGCKPAAEAPVATVVGALPEPECAYRGGLEQDGFTVIVAVPPGESCAAGTLQADISGPDGRQQSVSLERDGHVADMWMADLGSDGRLDVLITTRARGAAPFGSIALIVQDEGGRFMSHPVSDLPTELRRGYRGSDGFHVTEGRLYRNYPIYETGPSGELSVAGTRAVIYEADADRWVTLETRQTVPPGMDGGRPSVRGASRQDSPTSGSGSKQD